ncbi:Fic family protein [Pseudolysinimonas yzui]|uniref:Fic family protein n=1 Tax=Pseudolysinimonas yzui TaxID=2708254 RepID=UPI0017483646|nr:Fic family protein [Pseudolysinimonas yzui]
MSETTEGDSGAREEPVVAPYKAFPTFKEWVAAPFDASIFERFELQLEEARATADSSVFDEVVTQATRSAAVDTGALEGIFETDRGFTYSVAAGAAFADIRAVKGATAARAIEDALNAYEFVLNAATRKDYLTEVWIRDLHATICRSQETYTVVTEHGSAQRDLPKGVYKTEPNNPIHLNTNVIHSYAPVVDTAPEMARLVDELRSPRFEAAHPVLQASYAHYAFVCVHPFADGNGRVSRALASVYLYRRPGVPLVIYADQKAAYLDSLEAADRGDYAKFIDFVKFRLIDSLASARQDIRAAAAPSVAKQLEQLAILQTGRAGLPHAELDALASYLLEALRVAFGEHVTEALVTPPLSTRNQVTQGDPGATPPEGMRKVVQAPTFLDVQIASAAPGSATSRRLYLPMVTRPGVAGPDLSIVRDGEVVLEAFVHDVTPNISESLRHRASRVAATELSAMLSDVAAQSAESLRSTGYGV